MTMLEMETEHYGQRANLHIKETADGLRLKVQVSSIDDGILYLDKLEAQRLRHALCRWLFPA